MLESNLDCRSALNDAHAAYVVAPREVYVPPTAIVRMSRDPRRIESWALALTSTEIASLVQSGDGCLELHVLYDDLAKARAELDAIDEEDQAVNRAAAAEAAREPRPTSKYAPVGALFVAALLIAFYVLTGPRVGGSDWFASGASDAERVVHGEWWRTVTALTLHADSGHLLSNLGFGTVVVGAVMRSEGIGWGSALVLASGAAGNFANAWVHQTLHRSVGFSTAVFGAIGLLGGLAYMQRRAQSSRSRPAWTALATTLALLALLGVSDKGNVDVLAHVLGGVAGVGFGLLAGSSGFRPKTQAAQWLAGAGTTLVVLGAWFAAMT